MSETKIKVLKVEPMKHPEEFQKKEVQAKCILRFISID